MSVDYAIPIGTTASLGEIERVLRERFGFKVHQVSTAGTVRTLVGESVICSLMGENTIRAELVEEHFGFRPNMHVRFWINQSVDFPADLLIEAVAVLFQRLDCDLVMLENDEIPLVLRTEGCVTINDRDEYWISRIQQKFTAWGIESRLASLTAF